LEDTLQGEHLDEVAFDLELVAIDIPDRDWRLGNYQILEEIARGGMGVIYRARHLPSQRIVALKRVLTYHSDSQETLARFQREAQAAASLEHSNILPIYDVGATDDGLPYFSMKLAAGGSLQNVKDQFCDQPRCSADLISKIARAIDFAHRHGVVHRDLKPGNILLDAHGEPMVGDFGLAKWLDKGGDLTCTLTVFGTPGYIAPEQAQGIRAKQEPGVDIYSLGAIFFELLSGRPPFLGEHAIDVIRQATDKPAPKLRSVAPGAPRDLETICSRCLDRNPASRYESAADLAADVERWLDDRPIVARPLSPPARLWRWARRNRAFSAAICASSILAFTAVAWQIDSWRLDQRVRNEQIASHSVVILPILNLDEAIPEPELTFVVTNFFRARMAAVGPARVADWVAPPSKWTGAGSSAEVRSALVDANCRAALVGMVRQIPQGSRVSFRLVEKDRTEPVQNWTIDVPEGRDLTQSLVAQDISGSLYRMLDGSTKIPTQRLDPVFNDATARGFFNAGRALLDRRTIPDADHAINCFQGAVRAAPRSVLARSYLTMSYLGRNFLTADPKYIERAYEAANEALEISPNDPSAHSALCMLDTCVGHFDEALEHGLSALENGDSSERVCGQIAFIWEELGRPDKAIQWFNKAKMTEPQPADYDAILGDAWMLLAQDDKARDAYQASANFRPDLPEGWLGLCHLELLHGNFKQARLLFQQRAGEYSAFHTTKPFQAQIEFFARNYPEAERLYAEILAADPHGVGAQQYGAISSAAALAKLKSVQGDSANAQQLLKKSTLADQAELEKSPRYPEVLYRLAADEAIAGNVSAALTHLKASIAAGFIDYRSAKIDPRFDSLAANPEFQQILSQLSTHVANLRERSKSVNPTTQH
jgi:serine/threonine protein kinase/tetratricopeptide (TPR) repeat protein